MTDYALTAFAVNLIYLLIALAVMFGAAWVFNTLSKVQFHASFNTIETSPMALAVYFGARLIALAVIVSAFLA